MENKLEGIRSEFAKPNRRSGIIFVEDTECDCCDQIKRCAVIDLALVNFNWNVCEDCLMEFVNQIKTN